MAKITAIQPQKRDPHRVSVHLDGKYAFGLAQITAAWLTVGQELSQDKIAALQAADDRERAYQQALLFLSYRPRSESEVRQNLARHAYPAGVVEEALARLRQNRLVDDRQFARAWVENRNTFRPRSRRALQMELRQKGLSDDAAQAALEGLDDEVLAYAAGLKRVRRLRADEPGDFRKQLSAYLLRRGFTYSVAASAAARLWREAQMAGRTDSEADT